MKWLELKIPPLLVTLLFGLLIYLMPNPYKIENETITYGVSSIIFLTGCFPAILGVWEFRKKKTTMNPMTPQDSNSLVINGIYKFTRNPMYLGFLMWLFSFGIFMGNVLFFLPIIGFVLYMNQFQIFPEERVLEKQFGEDFQIYKKSVRRWL